jgi:NAD(P)-dependent dehydrogenase (short-subunit alcohol dehydrogenase family)
MIAGAFAKGAFAGRAVVVTGGGTGIGRELALAFAGAGADLVLASRKRANLERVAEEVRALSRRAVVVEANVREQLDCQRVAEAAVAELGRLDVLVNNAGANFGCPAMGISPNGWRTIVDVVLTGTFLMSQACGKVMLERRTGRIVNIAATNGMTASPLIAPSGAAKAGVINLTATLAVEWGPFGVTVNAVSPGAVDTPGASERIFPEAAKRAIARATPLGRMAGALDCVGAVLFLASDAAAFINGANLVVDGGAMHPRVPLAPEA